MRCSLVLIALLVACGSDARHTPDAPATVHDTGLDAPRDAAADVASDAPPCDTFVASTSTSTDVLSYTLQGGQFASYGCAPIDPTYWMSGSGMSATVTFVAAQSHPSIRVWGMNDDDTAAISVNGSPYALDATSAALSPKVVCGLSPGPDGMTFASGGLTGANTNGDGNYSYQDVTINADNVTSIEISSLTGLGWGFVGASAACATTTQLARVR